MSGLGASSSLASCELLFATVTDDRATSSGELRRFQVESNETTMTISNQISQLFT